VHGNTFSLVNRLISVLEANPFGKTCGRNARTRTKGILHPREYWALYERKGYYVLLRDRLKKNRSTA
jgi:hypothetical protein